MKAKDLDILQHMGWHVKVDYVDGNLQYVEHHHDFVAILARNDKDGFQGIKVPLDTDIELEQTLEEQVRQEFGLIKNKTLKWIRKVVK